MILQTPFKRPAYARIVVTPSECRRPSNALQTRNFTHSPSNALHTPSPSECRRPSNAFIHTPPTPPMRARSREGCARRLEGSGFANLSNELNIWRRLAREPRNRTCR
jgi:hypothetical protein